MATPSEAPATTSPPTPTTNKPTSTSSTEDNDDKETQLSPNAPVFFPKWKRSPQPGRRPFSGETDDQDSYTFTNDFGRSLSGGFNLAAANQLRSTPNHPPNRGRGGAFSSTMPHRNHPSPLGMKPGIGPGNLGPRSSSWREDATHSWRDIAPSAAAAAAVSAAAAAASAAGGDDNKSSKAITVEHRMIKPGSYSTWIRVLSADIGPAQLASVLSRCEESNNKGAIHVYLREKFINRQLVQQLKSQGYKFHHYVEDTQTFVYGKRPQDIEDGKELMNATAKELIGALVISPDEQQVLLLWEGGKWVFATGYTMTRESVVDALRRELRTQLSLEVDKAYAPRAVGGWTRASAKFDCINEVFMCYALRATSTVLNLDEDMHARWFNIDELMQLLDMVDAQFKQLGVEPKLDSAVEHPPGNVFSHLALRWVKTFRSGKAWPTSSVAERHVFCCI
jgi:ADP-ribose pyrophosphatase YjhB (NUDIX family)